MTDTYDTVLPSDSDEDGKEYNIDFSIMFIKKLLNYPTNFCKKKKKIIKSVEFFKNRSIKLLYVY